MPTLNVLNKPDTPCRSCVGWSWSKYGAGKGYVPADGTGRNGVLIVLEAAGETEEDIGKPVVGKAGYYLWSQLAKVGLDREDFRIHNCLSCRPPNNKLAKMPYEAEAIAHCSPLLDATIREHVVATTAAGKTPVILALGRIAFKRLIGLDDRAPLMKEDYQCYLHWLDRYGCWLIGADHPSYLMQGNHQYTPVLQYAAMRAVEVAATGFRYAEPSYLLDPDPAAFAEWVAAYLAALDRSDDVYLSTDIETPTKQKKDEEKLAREEDQDYIILRCGFAHRPGEAVSVPWTAPYMAAIERLLGDSRNKLVFWNYAYDRPRLQNQINVVGETHDAMLCLGSPCRIPLWDGSWTTMQNLVEQRLPATLIGMNDCGEHIPVKVVDWKRLPSPKQSWLKLKVDGSRFPIYCTPDHRIWINNGWCRADEVVCGDTVCLPSRGSSDLIHGTLLGDGAILANGLLQISHSADVKHQAAWLRIKARHLGVDTHEAPNNSLGKSGRRLMCSASVGRFWRSKFYATKANKKQWVAPSTDAALAVWYADDGNYHRNPGVKGGGRARFCCHAYTDQLPEIVEWFKARFGTDVAIHGGTMLVLSRKSCAAFFHAIAPWLPPPMQYKLHEDFRGLYNGWLEVNEARQGRVERVTTTKRPVPVRYCVVVDHPTHAFMTAGGLVHNCWHVLNSAIDKRLGFVTPFYGKNFRMWKHLSNEKPAYYNAVDADAALVNYLGIRADLERAGQLKVFQRHIIDLHKVTDRMSATGLMRDEEMRREAEGELAGLLADVEKRMDAAIPVEARREHVYKTRPRGDVVGLLVRPVQGCVPRCSVCNLAKPTKSHFKKFKRPTQARPQNPCADGSVVISTEPVDQYYKLLEWKKSKVQLLNYQKALSHQAVVNRKENRITFDEDAVKKLMRQYPKDVLYPLLLDHAKYQKLLSTYVGVTQEDGSIKGGLRVGRDGLIHPEYTDNPSTLRMACQNPNMQNLPRVSRTDRLVSIIRNLIVARSEHVFIERDYSAIEAVLVGYFARSPEYIRLAKLGIHAYLASHVLKRPADLKWSDADLKAYFKEIKGSKDQAVIDIYNGSKRTSHLSAYGGTPMKMYLAEPDIFPSTKYAAWLQDIYFELCPAVKRWQEETRLEAHKNGFLRNPYGYIHRFTHVYRNVKEGGKWIRKPGDQANDALAFGPQSTTAAIIKEAMLRLAEDEQMLEALRLQVHDSLLLEALKQYADEVDEKLKIEMERPVLELPLPARYNMGSHLVIDTDGKRGVRWGSLS